MNYIIKSEKLTATITDVGAELLSVVGADGHEYIWCGDERYWEDRAPVLFPTCGSLFKNTYTYDGKSYQMFIHGFAGKSLFKVVSAEEDKITLSLSANEKTKEQYPFDFELVAEYSVTNNELNASFTVKNTGSDVLPYMFGWHPGFVLEGDESVEAFEVRFDNKKELDWHRLFRPAGICPFPLNYHLENSAYVINEDELYSNDTMIFRGTGEHAILTSPKSVHTVDISWSKNLPVFCIWKFESSDARFVCLEPWSDSPGCGVPEDFSTKKMSRLSIGAKETYCYNVKFS